MTVEGLLEALANMPPDAEVYVMAAGIKRAAFDVLCDQDGVSIEDEG